MKTVASSVTTMSLLIAMLVFAAAYSIPAAAQINNDIGDSPFRRVYEKVAPSVVMIEVKGQLQQRNSARNPMIPWMQVPQRQDRNRTYEGMGSGVIIDRDGHIVTNNHVIIKPDQETVAEEITVILHSGDKYDATVIGRDPDTDLAVIKLELGGDMLPAEYVADLGDSDTAKPGDYAIANGNPLGLESTISVGIISAVGRSDVPTPQGAMGLQYKDYIQTDAQINPGNSGGALVNIQGELIGINDMYTAQYAGIGFAIPINLARNVIEQLIESGEVKRGFVGLSGTDINREMQEALNLNSREGALIEDVVPGYPADKAGLKHGDVVVTLNGQHVTDYNDFRFRIAEYRPGETVTLGIIRSGERQEIKLTLADRSEYIATAATGSLNAGDEWRGIHVVDLDDPEAGNFDLENIDSGVLIVGIDSDSPAAETTLAVGDVIVEIDDTTIDNLAQFKRTREELREQKKPILIYRLRKISNGRILKGFVAVKSD